MPHLVEGTAQVCPEVPSRGTGKTVRPWALLMGYPEIQPVTQLFPHMFPIFSHIFPASSWGITPFSMCKLCEDCANCIYSSRIRPPKKLDFLRADLWSKNSPWAQTRWISLHTHIGSMYTIYGNIYHQYTPNVSIYTNHGSYGIG